MSHRPHSCPEWNKYAAEKLPLGSLRLVAAACLTRLLCHAVILPRGMPAISYAECTLPPSLSAVGGISPVFGVWLRALDEMAVQWYTSFLGIWPTCISHHLPFCHIHGRPAEGRIIHPI